MNAQTPIIAKGKIIDFKFEIPQLPLNLKIKSSLLLILIVAIWVDKVVARKNFYSIFFC